MHHPMNAPLLKQFVIVGNGRFAQLVTGLFIDSDRNLTKDEIKVLSERKHLSGSYEIVAIDKDLDLPISSRLGCVVIAQETSPNCIVVKGISSEEKAGLCEKCGDPINNAEYTICRKCDAEAQEYRQDVHDEMTAQGRADLP